MSVSLLSRSVDSASEFRLALASDADMAACERVV